MFRVKTLDEDEPMIIRKITIQDRWILIWGGPRRLFLRLFQGRYLRDSLSRRRGQCHRCGACCMMSWRCAHLCYRDDLSECAIYSKRKMPICADFPVDEQDLAYRDRIAPDRPCGYFWPQKKKNP
jgi:hypothetical protein